MSARRYAAYTFSQVEDGVERPGPGQAPIAFRIWRAGVNQTDRGPAIFSQASADALMAAQELRGNWYSVDVDHLSLSKDAPPEARKGVGRHRLGLRPGDGGPELWAVDCQWTEAVKRGLEMDPPEWMYYSPAYDIDTKTNEVVAYLNTALTNNPATWWATQLATAGGMTGNTMTKKEMVAALEHMSKGQGDGAAVAAAVLAMIKSGQMPKDEGEEAPPPSEKEEAPPPSEKEEEASAAPAKASVEATASPDMAVLARLQAVEAELARRKDSEERARLMASRADFAKEVREALANATLDQVRFAVANFPRSSANPAASVTVTATRGASQGNGRGALDPVVARRIDAQMGIRPQENAIRCEDGGRTHVLGALYGKAGSEEAAKIRARREPGMKEGA